MLPRFEAGRLRSLGALLLAGWVAILVPLATEARAQDAQSEGAADGGQGGGGDAAEDDEATVAASEAFKQGRDAFMADRFDEALAAFRRSYEFHPSPNSHLMIAKCLMGKSMDAAAYEELRLTVREAETSGDPKYKQTADSAREEMADLRKKIALLRLEIDGGADALPGDARITAGGREVERSRWGDEIAMPPGAATVTLSTADGEDEQAVSLEAGGEATVVLTPPKAGAGNGAPPDVQSDGGWFVENQRTMAYVVGGVGAAGMIVFGVFGGLTLARFDDLEKRCPAGECPAGTQSDIDSGKTYQTVANVGAIVGAIGLTAGVLLWVLHPDILEGGEKSEARTQLRMTAGAGGLTLGGTF